MIRVTHATPGIVHVQYDTQEELTQAFVRVQEFYESPYPEIRGKRFTLDEFVACYTHDHGAPFSYFTDWNGFNVPSHVVYDFLTTNRADLTHAETILIDEALRDYPKRSYLIGTWRPDDIDHEIAHALYYLDDHYAIEADKLIWQFRGSAEAAALAGWLHREGYSDLVQADEYNAYLSTNDRDDWVKDFGTLMGPALFEAGEPFRDLFNFTLAE